MGFVVSLAAGLGVIFSAETLILLGNGVGQGGIWFLAFLVAGAVLHLFGAFTLFANFPDPKGETRLLQEGLGNRAALILPFSSRLSFAVIMATGSVVTAGFVFNEVFAYWFPNFLFAYLLLGLILAVNLLGRAVWGKFQVLVMLTALLGLIVLIVPGFALTSPPISTDYQPAPFSSLLRTALVALLLPIGYDLTVFANGESTSNHKKSPAAAVLLGSLFLLLWGVVSLHWIAPSTLAQTTIPYTVTARTIMGQKGRIIVGIVILAGTAGAVNALFGGVSRMTAAMASAGLLPSFFGDNRCKGRLTPVFLTAATSAMLFAGMAGSSHLDAFLRGSLILWLFHYAALHFAHFKAKRGDCRPRSRCSHLSVSALLALAALGLLLTDGEKKIVAAFLIVIVGSVVILAAWSTGVIRTRRQG
ncbi:MAG: amino acid permease [Desulforhabdus sp.]|jgi:amino acid transporter|nr:amino acid permease [Desulforhabdus sp.]